MQQQPGRRTTGAAPGLVETARAARNEVTAVLLAVAAVQQRHVLVIAAAAAVSRLRHGEDERGLQRGCQEGQEWRRCGGRSHESRGVNEVHRVYGNDSSPVVRLLLLPLLGM